MKRYWTRERVIEALRGAMKEIRGKLPCDDLRYNRLKTGRSEWPPVMRIYEYFHSLGRAWMAAGAKKTRISLYNIAWTPEDDNYLLEKAGMLSLETIANHLCRTKGSCRTRLNKFHRIHARDNQGYLSAAQLAKLYKCPYQRILQALKDGKIKGFFDPLRNRWNVDLANITPEAERILKAPKERSYKTFPPDLGDYRKRYGIRRRLVDGKMEDYEAALQPV